MAWDAPSGQYSTSQGCVDRITFRPYCQLLTQPIARIVTIGMFVEGLCAFGVFAYIGAFLRDRYSLSYVVIGFMLSGFGFGGLIYSRSAHNLSCYSREDNLSL